ncbi:MAG: YegS/Rv2252/BmrU family lipid kinase, partial [Chloroflexota bacterium]|nr:YegS/Rv2252/BmrU family lipid kinase [Chloroflexota bacterium]
MAKEMKLIVNPAAANGAAGKRWPQVCDFLHHQGANFEAELTEARGHATKLARQALDEGYRLIVAVGGDGTANEVVNGLVVGGSIDPAVTMGILPLGVGTDFAHILGISRDYKIACQRLLEGKERIIDLGQIACIREGREVDRYFVNAAGLGFDAEVANLTNRLSKLKALGGTIPYVISLLITLAAYRNKNMEISFDGQSLKMRA